MRHAIVPAILACCLLGPVSAGRCADGDIEKKAVSDGAAVNLEERRVADDAPGFGYDVAKMLGALAIVAALIFLAGYLMRRMGGRSAAKASPVLEILARTRVSPRQQILLVRLGRRLVLVGSGADGMAVLTEVTDADEVADLLDAAGIPEHSSRGACDKTAPVAQVDQGGGS